jgi:hypothetical protein
VCLDAAIPAYETLEFWRISTEKWTGSGELVTSRSWATIPVDPSAVIAGDETAAATLHIADRRAGATDTAWARGWVTRSRSRRDGGDECDEAENDGTHFVRFCG